MGVLLVDPNSMGDLWSALKWLLMLTTMKEDNSQERVTMIRDRLVRHAVEYLGHGWSHLGQSLASAAIEHCSIMREMGSDEMTL